MTNHLSAGCAGNAEIAVQEEVAQAASLVLGIAGLDVGKCFDGCVLIHDDLHHRWCVRNHHEASKFLAASHRRVRARLGYAKITPAAATRGNRGWVRVDAWNRLAKGMIPIFGLVRRYDSNQTAARSDATFSPSLEQPAARLTPLG
jgi:hypothetical protein